MNFLKNRRLVVAVVIAAVVAVYFFTPSAEERLEKRVDEIANQIK